jgi:hypothetical protein
MIKLSAFLPIALLMARGSGLAQARPLEVRWNELAPMVSGHSVTLTLADGMQVKGQAVAVREDALLLKGNGSVPRGSVVSIDVKRERGIGGRVMGTVVGTLGGMGLGAWVDARNNVLRRTLGEDVGTFVGIAAGGAAAGYFAGVAIDRKVTHIRVVP